MAPDRTYCVLSFISLVAMGRNHTSQTKRLISNCFLKNERFLDSLLGDQTSPVTSHNPQLRIHSPSSLDYVTSYDVT